MVVDSLSELRLLAQSSLRYRRQILALKQFFADRSCTVLMLDDNTSSASDLRLHSIAHGVAINYTRAAPPRGERAALFAFDERSEVLLHRAAGLGMDLTPFIRDKTLTL